MDRLFDTPHNAFCPGEHCSVPCGPRTCTCKPCELGCVFCTARRRKPVRFEIPVVFANRQLHLFGGPLQLRRTVK